MTNLTRRLAGSALGLAALALPITAAAPAHAQEQAQARDGMSTQAVLPWHPVAGNQVPPGWACGATYDLPQLSYQACVTASSAGYRGAIIVRNRADRPVSVVDTHLTTAVYGPSAATFRDTCANSVIAAHGLVMCWSNLIPPLSTDTGVQAFAQSGTGGTVHSPVVPV